MLFLTLDSEVGWNSIPILIFAIATMEECPPQPSPPRTRGSKRFAPRSPSYASWGWQSSTALEGCSVIAVVVLGARQRARADASAPRRFTRFGAGAFAPRGCTRVTAGVAYATGVLAGLGHRWVVVHVGVAMAAGRVAESPFACVVDIRGPAGGPAGGPAIRLVVLVPVRDPRVPCVGRR